VSYVRTMVWRDLIKVSTCRTVDTAMSDPCMLSTWQVLRAAERILSTASCVLLVVKEDLLSVVIAGGGRTSTVLDSPS